MDASLQRRLRGVAKRLRTCVLVEGAAWLLGFLIVAAALTFLLDYGLRGLQWSMRATMLGLIFAGAAWLIRLRLIGPLRLHFDSADVAKLVERRYPDLTSSLVSAVRFAEGRVGPPTINSPELMRLVMAGAVHQAGKIDFNTVVGSRRARWSAAVLVAGFVIGATTTYAAPETTSLWFLRNILLKEIAWPKRTHLIVELDGDELIAARGDDVVVSAYAEGVQPREVDFIYETASEKRGREVMVTVGRGDSFRYRHTFRNAQEDFTFYLEGGDDRTQPIQARLLERPRVAHTQMRIVPPPYTREEPFELPDGQRAVQILPGTEVTIWIRTIKPVQKATLMTGSNALVEAERDGDMWAATIAPVETHTYHFALVDEVGLENRRPVRFAVRVVADEPPAARMTLAGVGDLITPEAVLPIAIECADAYGLASVELTYTAERESTVHGGIDLPAFVPGMTHFSSAVDWPVASVPVEPGDRLTLQAAALDENDVTGPGTAQTPERTLRVVTRDEMLAELARREQEYRVDFERVIDAQEALRGALLTVFGRFQEGLDPASLAAELTPLERRQRNITGSVNLLRQQFEQILSEMRVNRLDSPEEQQRLGEQIIAPLTRLARRDLILAADTIRQWSRDAAAETASTVDPQQVAILSQMRTIHANMVQWEGYQEVVNMLRDIIRLQKELKEETKESLQRQAFEVFDE